MNSRLRVHVDEDDERDERGGEDEGLERGEDRDRERDDEEGFRFVVPVTEEVAAEESAAAATKKSMRRSSVEVVRSRPSQFSVEVCGISGAMRRCTELLRRCMQWWVERRMEVSVKGGA